MVIYNRDKGGEVTSFSPKDNNISYHNKIENFTIELVTEKGSSLFDKNYGTTFINDLGEQINEYKVKYYIENSYEETKKKYDIMLVEVTSVEYSRSNNSLDIDMVIAFKDVSFQTKIEMPYTGSYTTKPILEIN